MSIARNIGDVLFRYQIVPADGFVYLNEAISVLTGYSLSDWLEDPKFINKVIAPQDLELFERVISDTTNGSSVLHLVCRDGTIRAFDFHYVHLVSPEGQILAIEGTLHSRMNDPLIAQPKVEMSLENRVEFYADKLKTAGNIGMALTEKLSLRDVYTLLSSAMIDLYPDLRMITIARYHAETSQIFCVSAVIENETVDTSLFPPVPLEPRGRGTQSEAIHTRKAVLIPDLNERLKSQKVFLVDKEGAESGTAPQSALCVPMLAKGEVLGVIQLQSPVLNRFSNADAEMLTIVANTAAIAILNATLAENLNNSRIAIQNAYDATLQSLSHLMEIRGHEPEGHARQVAEMALNFGRHLRLSANQLVDLWRGAYLHDVGKICVPDAILDKKGPLTNAEIAELRKHTEWGARILSDVPLLKNALEVTRFHHENWDGSGYPAGLKGEKIPLAARIFRVVDEWNTLLTDQPGRKAWSRDEVIAYLQDGSTSHYDPQLVKEFLTFIAHPTG